MGDFPQTADGRNHSLQDAGIRKKRARRAAAAPDLLCGREIGGGAQRRSAFHIPAFCGLWFLPSAVCF
jgi:hypothetical protein